MAGNKFEAQLGLNTKEFESKLGKMGGMIAGAFSVHAIAGFTKEVVLLAAKAEGISNAFKQLNKPGLLDDLRKATRGAVNDMQLMQNAIKARNFKIPLSEMATLFDFATQRAIQTGESVDYLVDSIILGIGRKSPLILDNLGISAIELRKKFKGIGLEAASVADVAKAMNEIIQEQMKESGNVADTTATKIEKITAAWANLKVQLGTNINTQLSGFVGIFENFYDKLAKLIEPKVIERVLQGKNVPFAGFVLPQTDPITSDRGGRKTTIATLTSQLADEKTILEQINILDAKNLELQVKKIHALEQQISTLTSLPRMKNIGEGLKSISGKSPTLGGVSIDTSGLRPMRGADVGFDQLVQTNILLAEQESLILGLAGGYSSLFGNISEGFEGVVQSVIMGIKKIVAELAAKAFILAILSAITGNPVLTIGNVLGFDPSMMKRVKPAGVPTGLGSGVLPGAGGIIAEGFASGKDMKIVLRRN